MIYFRDPRLKVREEAWGGVAETVGGIILLTKEQYEFLVVFVEISVSDGEEPPEVIEALMGKGAVLSVSREEIERARKDSESLIRSFLFVSKC